MTEKDIKIVELRVNGRQAAEQLWELKKRVKEGKQQKNCTNRWVDAVCMPEVQIALERSMFTSCRSSFCRHNLVRRSNPSFRCIPFCSRSCNPSCKTSYLPSCSTFCLLSCSISCRLFCSKIPFCQLASRLVQQRWGRKWAKQRMRST